MAKKLKPMVRLNKDQIEQKQLFIDNYKGAKNAATGSSVDANSNVVSKTVATLGAELFKDFHIQINRKTVCDKIAEMFDQETADKYVEWLEDHRIYRHDETAQTPGTPYCVAINMYPFLEHGMTKLGGESKAPKHLESYCGSFINLVFAISSQFAGAVATVEFLLYFHYFAKKDYGADYLHTETERVKSKLQHVVYSLNQPAASRGYQCVRETTELLTPEGYKKVSELKVGDLCYTYDINTRQLKKEPIKALNIQPFSGNMIRFSGRNYQQTVTPNHRVVRRIANSNKLEIIEAEKLAKKNKSYLRFPIAPEKSFTEDYPISDDILKLLVFVLTEGTMAEGAPSKVRIYKSPNRWGNEELKDILERNGIGYSVVERQHAFGPVNSYTINQVDAAIIQRFLKHTKKEIPFFFTLLSQRQAQLVIDTWSKLDGCNITMQCDNKNIADRLQQVAFIAGCGSKVVKNNYSTIDGTKPSEKESYNVQMFKRDFKAAKTEYVEYSGNVWCPTTDTGVVVFREENGIPYISGNSVFWNVSVFDRYFYESMFGNFMFPDFTKVDYDEFNEMQKFFLEWLLDERSKSLLTFPVLTEASLNAEDDAKDLEWADFIAEIRAKGLSMFSFNDKNASALSSCCRLSSKFDEDFNDFSFSLGAGGVSTGSTSVITININNVIQKGYELEETIKEVQKFQVANRKLVEEYVSDGLLPAYNAGFISLDKQFVTLGVLGLNEAAEYLGYTVGNNDAYKDWAAGIFKLFSDLNSEARQKYGIKFNTECVPGESLGVKFANWDKEAGLKVNRDCYNSYMYLPESTDTSIPDKFQLHGGNIAEMQDGGSALHCNLSQLPDKELFRWLRKLAAVYGTKYWTTNVLTSVCEECGHIDMRTVDVCSVCGSTNINWATRVIGYLRKIANYSEGRQKEAAIRYYH